MSVDTELIFECLMYLNLFYYPVFGTCETIMTAAKYRSIIDTPRIASDAAVVGTKLSVELLKILIYRNFKDFRRRTVTGITVLLTLVTIGTLFYAFFIQSPVLKLESILNSLTIMLATTEVVFGILEILPCCQKPHYY